MLGTGDFYRSNGCAFERRQQDAPEGVSNGVAIAGLKRLSGEFSVSICRRALVFGESLRHLETTVADRHNLIFNWRISIFDWMRNSNDEWAIANLRSESIAGFPLASAISHPAMETQGPTA